MAYTSITESNWRDKPVAKAEFFDVVKQGTFYFEISPCMKIEELSDTFMTREALELMNVGNSHWEYYSRIYMIAEITETMKEWAAMIPDGCQGTTKNNTKIRTLQRELTHEKMRDYAPNDFTIRGNRIINTERRNVRIHEMAQQEAERNKQLREAKEAAPYERPDYITHTDRQYIWNAFGDIAEREYGVSISPRYHTNTTKSIFTLFKRLTSWDEIAKQHRKHAKKKEYLQDLKFMKKLWDDPSLEP